MRNYHYNIGNLSQKFEGIKTEVENEAANMMQKFHGFSQVPTKNRMFKAEIKYWFAQYSLGDIAKKYKKRASGEASSSELD